MPDGNDGFLMMFRAESLFSWTEYINVNRPQDEEDDIESAALAAEDMDSMTVARDGETSVAKLRFDLDLPPAGEDDTPLGKASHYQSGIIKNKSCSLTTAVCKNLYLHKLNLANCRHSCGAPQGVYVVSFKRWRQPELGSKGSKMVKKLTSTLGCGRRLICSAALTLTVAACFARK